MGDLLGISATGQLSIGTLTPNSFKFKVRHGAYGMALENTTNNTWELLNASDFYLIYNGSVRGSFNGTTGVYSSVSDERLKTEQYWTCLQLLRRLTS